jgi:hypothetical protein
MELNEALKVIKRHCINQSYCSQCCLSINYETCAIKNDVPENWRLVNDIDEPDNQRLFKEGEDW